MSATLLIVGAGSIGRRYARLARALDLQELLVFDRDAGRTRALAETTGARACRDLAEALDRAPEAAIVATPPDDHVATATRAIRAGCDVLVEKPLAERIEPARRLVDAATVAGRGLFVVCNMRFHPGPATLKARLAEVGVPWFARAHVGQWLPDMRPGADYRELYCAKAGTGGGVVLDAIHEIDYLVWLFGPVVAVTGTTARLSDLAIEAEDYAAITLRHASGVRSEIHLDYLQACKRRGCEIVGSEGTLLWESEGADPEQCRVRAFTRGGSRWAILHECAAVDPDAMYRTLLARFLETVRGQAAEDMLDGTSATEVLAIALAARDSHD